MSNFELLCKLLLYFDRRRFLAEMKNNCDSLLGQCIEKTNSKFPPLRHLLEIDVMDLLNIFPVLGDFLLNEPLRFQSFCKEIFFACIKSVDNDNTQNVLSMQVAVILRLKCFPSLLSYPKQRHYNGIMLLNGLLLDISKPNSYVFHTIWSCPEECEGNEVILQFIPKIPPKCCVCKSILYENSGLRRCGEKVIATFLSNHDLLPKKYFIVDDLITKLKVGSRYNVHIVVFKNIKSVWSLEETPYLPTPLTFPVPEDIEHLFEVSSCVTWKFIYCLASSIGVRVGPLHSFMHVKIYLLLSLVSIKCNSLLGSPIIHILISGYDTKYVGDLMRDAAKFADRSTCLGNSNSSVALSLIASSGGVCILPLPLYLYNQKQLSAITKTLESGEISLENGEIKVQCAVWANSVDTKKIQISNLSSIFSATCRADCGQYSEDILESTLQNAIEQTRKSKDEVKAVNDVMAYINLIAGIKVNLDKTVENLLKNYFIAARKERAKAATIGSIGALVAVTLISARLCRRSVATVDDAIFAIWLHVSGGPDPRFAPEEYLQTPASMHKLEEIMNSFKYWLEQFTGCCITPP